MPSATSYSKSRKPCPWFNSTLFRKNLARFWPIWVLYGVIWFLILTVPFLTRSNLMNDTLYYSRGYVLDTIIFGVPISLVFGIFAAMAVFSYLYNSRPAGLMHALPIRREGLFLTNYLSGLSFFILPILVVALLTVAAELFAGCPIDFTALFLWGWCQALISLFFYSFAVFCSMFTGHILALPIFYGILNCLIYTLAFLFQQMAELFLLGYANHFSLLSTHELVTWCTPVMQYFLTIGTSSSPNYRFTGLQPIFVYGLVALVLTALALLVYRRRHIERAGDVVSVSWVRPIFKYGVAFCTAVTLGSLLWSIFVPSSYARTSFLSLLFFILLAGILGYFVAEMLLRKSFWVFRKSWKGCVLFTLVLGLATSAMGLDVTGFEDRVPSADQVSSVLVASSSLAPYDDGSFLMDDSLTDPQEIEQIIALHNSIVEHKQSIKEDADLGYTWAEIGTMSVEESSSFYIDLSYLLKNGKTMTRTYHIPITQALLDTPDTPAALIEALFNDPDGREDIYFRNYDSRDTLISAYISTLSDERVYIFDSQLEALFDATRADLAAGRLGRHYPLENVERLETCYYNDLTFTFYPSSQRTAPGAVDEDNTYGITITLQTTATETLNLLEEFGLSDQLVTKAQSEY